ncbi:MAG: GNAT family N-acetyltransferase [Flavobacteriales bacterium]|nr:GNAT family N-acetyltransferase [Flavobacteriales bacterium]
MTIREFKPSDHNACIQIFQKNLGIYFAMEELALFQNWLYNHSEYPYFVVQDGHKIIACGGIYMDSRYAKAGLSWGMVDPKYHSKGIGTELTLFRLKLIREVYPNQHCFIETSQHTKGFYQKMGFQTKNITKNGLGKGLDKYYMELNAA